jgi:hypothetical protein
MRHYIDTSDIDEFRRQFSVIREAFVLKLERTALRLQTNVFRACLEGEPYEWLWDSSVFRNVGWVGTLDDAKGLATNMINEGMAFAYGCSIDEGLVTIWLSTWEPGEKGPVWPEHTRVVEEHIHDGISQGKPPLI